MTVRLFLGGPFSGELRDVPESCGARYEIFLPNSIEPGRRLDDDGLQGVTVPDRACYEIRSIGLFRRRVDVMAHVGLSEFDLNELGWIFLISSLAKRLEKR